MSPTSRPAKFPLVADLIALGADAAGPAREGDVLVYTNLDISCSPLLRVRRLAGHSGRPAHVINRRTIPGHYDSPGRSTRCSPNPASAMAAGTASSSRVHSSVRWSSTASASAPYIGLAMLANLDALSGFRLVEHKHLHLTFHIGDDATWRGRTDLSEHNRLRLRASLDRLRAAHAPVPARASSSSVDAELFDRPRRQGALRHRRAVSSASADSRTPARLAFLF